MECVDFMQPRWPSRISTFNSIFCRSFRFGTRESVGDIVVTHLPAWVPLVCIVAISDTCRLEVASLSSGKSTCTTGRLYTQVVLAKEGC